jgi:hypothetical protein
VVALNGLTENGLSVVGRVRQLLMDFEGARGGAAAPEARDRLSRASNQGTACKDLRELEERLQRLEGLFPGCGVASGPLLESVRKHFLNGRQQGGLDVFPRNASAPRRLEP